MECQCGLSFRFDAGFFDNRTSLADLELFPERPLPTARAAMAGVEADRRESVSTDDASPSRRRGEAAEGATAAAGFHVTGVIGLPSNGKKYL